MQNKDFFSGVPIEVREFLLRLLNQNLRQNLSYKQPKAPEGAFYAGTSSIRRPIFFFTATKFGNISVRRFVLDIFANGINTLSMFTFIESDIFLFHVLLQVRLPHYQPTVLLTWKLLMALIQ